MDGGILKYHPKQGSIIYYLYATCVPLLPPLPYFLLAVVFGITIPIPGREYMVQAGSRFHNFVVGRVGLVHLEKCPTSGQKTCFSLPLNNNT
jgi:hypothetical protein